MLFVRFLSAQTDSIPTGRNPVQYTVTDIYLHTVQQDNGAAGCFLSQSSVSAHFDNRFLVKEMMTKRVGAVFRKGQNVFTANCQHFGYSRYGELAANVGYSRRFGKHIAFGMRFFYLMSHNSEYPCIHSISFDLSCYATIGKGFGLGFSVYNPARLKVGITGKSTLPIRLQFDLNYKVGKQILLFSRIEKELKSPLCVEVGAIYKIKVLYLTATVGFPSPSGSINVQIACGRWLLGIRGNYLMKAGFIPEAMVTCLF